MSEPRGGADGKLIPFSSNLGSGTSEPTEGAGVTPCPPEATTWRDRGEQTTKHKVNVCANNSVSKFDV